MVPPWMNWLYPAPSNAAENLEEIQRGLNFAIRIKNAFDKAGLRKTFLTTVK
jgi:hypothetical protein